MAMAFVELERRGTTGIITMNRPEALNALNDQVLRDLEQVLDQVEQEEEILVAVITGAGRSFVAGADIGQMSQLSAVEAKKFGVYGNQVFLKLENLTKPTIAAVNGFALGGGCELSLACDIRLASEKAKFGQPEVGLGITPGFGGTQRLPRLIGVSRAMELILTARTISAQEALELGLVSHVYGPEELMDRALSWRTPLPPMPRWRCGSPRPLSAGGCRRIWPPARPMRARPLPCALPQWIKRRPCGPS